MGHFTFSGGWALMTYSEKFSALGLRIGVNCVVYAASH